MRIVLNGDSVDVEDGTSLGDLVVAYLSSNWNHGNGTASNKARVSGVAVALNAEVVPRSRWVETSLGPGDRVEILGASQGG